MINSGKIKIDNKEYNIFLEEVGVSTPIAPTIPSTPEPTVQGIISVTPGSISNNKRVFVVKTKDLKDIGYGETPDRWYTFPSNGTVEVPSDSLWIVVLRFQNGSKASIKLNGVDGSFQLTGSEIITETVVNTTPPVVVPNPSGSSFSFNTPQLNLAPLNQRIKLSNKVHFQTSAWSAGRFGSSAMRFQISRDGRVIHNLEVADNSYPIEVNNPFNLGKHSEDLKNNHPTSTKLILPEGNYKIEYQNSSKGIDYPIVFTLIDSKNAGYFVYYACGLKKPETSFFKQLNKGESLTTNLNLYDNVGTVKQQGSNLKKAVFINFIVDGKLSLERFEVDFGNGQYQTHDYTRAISPVDDTKLRYVMEKDHSKFIEIMFYPNSKEFMVVAKNGVDVSEEHIDISESVFDYTNWNTNGVKFPSFKMTNNSGFEMFNQFGSIMQKNSNGDLVENGDDNVIIPFINGEYKSTQSWRYNCES